MFRLTNEEIDRLKAIATDAEVHGVSHEKQLIRELAMTLLHTIYDLQTLEHKVGGNR
jgi:hypothetical protein